MAPSRAGAAGPAGTGAVGTMRGRSPPARGRPARPAADATPRQAAFAIGDSGDDECIVAVYSRGSKHSVFPDDDGNFPDADSRLERALAPLADFLQRPHTLLSLAAAVGVLVYASGVLHGDPAAGGPAGSSSSGAGASGAASAASAAAQTALNARAGVLAACAIFLLYSVLQGPDTLMLRPHPAFWRLVHGVVVLYLLLLVYLLFQTPADARLFMRHLSPSLGVAPPERSYGADCRLWTPRADAIAHLQAASAVASDDASPPSPSPSPAPAPAPAYASSASAPTFSEASILWARLRNLRATLFDEFVVAHTLGWWAKATVLRDAALLWLVSIGFELAEASFAHLLPNFNECWWDSWLLDVAICNALGIWAGLGTVAYFGSRTYDWAGLRRRGGGGRRRLLGAGPLAERGGELASPTPGSAGPASPSRGRTPDGRTHRRGAGRASAAVSPAPARGRGGPATPSGAAAASPPAAAAPLTRALARAALQFTPARVERFAWRPGASPLRCAQAGFVVLTVLAFEVNAFFLKSVLWVPPRDPLNSLRLLLWFALAMPAVNEYYLFIESAGGSLYRMGSFAWLSMALVAVEWLVILKVGRGMFRARAPRAVVAAWAVATIGAGGGLGVWAWRRRRAARAEAATAAEGRAVGGRRRAKRE